MNFNRSDSIIRVFDAAGKVIDTHEHKRDLDGFSVSFRPAATGSI
jgi:hypothetical protein